MLAAGLDTRAYRLPWSPQTVLFEVDQPRLLADKQATLDAAQARLECDRRPVPVDLGGDWTAPLEQAGNRRTNPAVFIAEGVLCYLSESAVRAVLSAAAEIAAPGSRLAVDLLTDCGWRVDSIDEPGGENASYGRWPYPPTAVGTPGLPRNFLLTATRPG